MNRYQLGIFNTVKLNRFPTIIPAPFISQYTPHWYKCGSSNRLMHWLQNNKSELNSYPPDFLYTTWGNISSEIPTHNQRYYKNTIFLLILVALHGVCFQIFHIWNNRLIGDPFWNIYCGIIGWIITRTSSVGFSIPLNVSLPVTLVTSCNCNWVGR